VTESRGGGAAATGCIYICLLEMIRRGFLLVGARPRQDAVEADVVLVTRGFVRSAAFWANQTTQSTDESRWQDR
jgi:hypothetical protein